MTRLTYIRGGQTAEGAPFRQVWRRTLGDGETPAAVTVLNGVAREHWVRDNEGAFSIKWAPAGRMVYRSEGASHHLGGQSAVILNAAQPYELEFTDRAGTESLCVFVSDDLVAEAWRDLADPDAVDGEAAEASPPQFPDLVFRMPDDIAVELANLRNGFAGHDPSALAAEEELLSLVRRLVATAHGHRRFAQRLPARKASTRRLLAARVQRARELIEASSAEPSLDELARASALSKFHLIRLFKAAFGCTPAAYAGQRRMLSARTLLQATPMTVAAIGQALGYESPSAFVRAFRRHFGVPPSAIRV
ncbi:MAG TPA: AraC family transcriptional regulator [Caulobacteraceae bacterium]|jgi:AraC-like DNA-binding protein